LFLFLLLFRRYFDPATTYPQVLTQYTAETFCASFHFKCPSGFQFNATDLPRSRVRVFLSCSDFPSSCIYCINPHLVRKRISEIILFDIYKLFKNSIFICPVQWSGMKYIS
jgi:hypothetical protein